MKRGLTKYQLYLLSIILIIFLLVPIISAQDTLSYNTPAGEINPETGLPKGIAQIQNVTETLSDSEKTSKYLKEEWEKIIQKHPVFSTIHNFLKEWDIVFVILLDMHYELSLALFFAVILWIILAIKLPEWIYVGMAKSLAKSKGIAILATILGAAAVLLGLGRLRLFKIFGIFLSNFFTNQEVWWAKLIVGAVIMGVFVVIYYFESEISKYVNARDVKQQKQRSEFATEKLERLTKVRG